jgi:hypothetical protein
MGLKKGTKLTDNPRDINMRIRLTKEESQMLVDCSEKLNCTKTDVIVKGIGLVNAEIKAK